MKKHWKKIVVIGVIAVILVFIILKMVGGKDVPDQRRQGAVRVVIEKPHRMMINTTLQFNGDIIPIQQANIYAKVNGTLERVFVNIGDHVNTNQMLALIDTVELAQQVQQTAATYQNMEANYARSKELAEQNLVSKQDLDNADAAKKVAKANYETAKIRRGFAAIQAPFSGYITKRLLDPGAVVTTTNATLFSLMDIDVVKIIINVLEKDFLSVKKGMHVSLTVDAYPGRTFEGTITRFSEALDISTRTMAVEVDVANRDHALKGGMYATVSLNVNTHPDAVTVPTKAILKDAKGLYIFSVEKNIAVRIPITVGGEQDSRTEILSGITDSQSIIISGQQFVKDGGPVLVQK